MELESRNATRFRVTYRGMNLYIIVSDDGILLNTENSDQFKTLAGLALVETTLNRILEDTDLEELAGICFSCSFVRDDLPRLIHDAILWHIDREQGKRKGK